MKIQLSTTLTVSELRELLADLIGEGFEQLPAEALALSLIGDDGEAVVLSDSDQLRLSGTKDKQP